MIHERIPEQLADLRLAAGMSQAELSRRSGVNKNTISRYERGLCDVATFTADILAQTLGHQLQLIPSEPQP